MVKELNKQESNYQRFLSGEYCNCLTEEVLTMIASTNEYLSHLRDFTLTENERYDIFTKMLGSIGRYSSIGKNFTCQCGKHIFIGEKTIININCTMMDENHIYIGNKVMVAPNVQFYTATHPIDAKKRFLENWDEASGELFFRTKALPITVGDKVWIGGGAIILAGVTIGENSIIGAGSVVTKSIPANCLAVGNPCKVIKHLYSIGKIRTATETDIPELRELFRSTVLTINSKDYTADEIADWASCGNSVEHWRNLLANYHYFAALDEQGKIIGFSSINKNGYLHSMFIHKEWQRKGIASELLMEVEKHVAAYNVSEITADVSITARTFFEKHGYKVIKVQKSKANKLELTNYFMKKTYL